MAPERPLVSLILPNRDNGPVLDEFFQKLADHTTYEHVELIVADDGSTDDSLEIIHRWRASGRFGDFPVIEREYRGIIDTCNDMLALATGEFVVKLDGDATVETPGWLEKVLAFIRSDDRIGAVQSRVVFDSGLVHSLGVEIVCREGFHDRGSTITEPIGRREALGPLARVREDDVPGIDSIAEIDGVLGCWATYRRSLLDAAGGFDAGYHPVWYEDIDVAFAGRVEGFKEFYLPDVRIVHHVGRRDPRIESGRAKRLLFEANRRIGRFVPQGLKDAVSGAARLGDRDPAKVAIIERHRDYWRQKWGFDPVNPDLDAILARYAGTEVCWRYDDERRREGEEIVRRYLESRVAA